MPKSCMDCQKYPLCRLFTKISKAIDEESIINSRTHVFISLASHCGYYVEVIDED